MGRFIEGTDRKQATLFPECLEDWICEDNSVRVIEVFVDKLNLAELGLGSVDPDNRTPFIPCIGTAEAIHLRLPKSSSVQPAA